MEGLEGLAAGPTVITTADITISKGARLKFPRKKIARDICSNAAGMSNLIGDESQLRP